MRTTIPVLVSLLLPMICQGAGYTGPPVLDVEVMTGELPPVESRLPLEPRVMDLASRDKVPGRHGGSLRMIMAKDKDIRMMTVYGYARLVTITPDLELVPDILADYTVEENRVFTFHLRPGHRWSDGTPFTSAAFRYYWEDVANDPELSPVGPPQIFLIDGEPPAVEYPDDYTVCYTWSRPNPFFLTSLAEASPQYIYRPGHYLRQFHVRYADQDLLDRMVEEAGARTWAGLHHRMDRAYRQSNPDLPSLQPWINTTEPPAERFVFRRNPYFHRVDPNGLQLPYIDEVVIEIASSSLVPVKSGAGDTDLQGRYLRLEDYTFLKQGEKRADYSVRLWQTVAGAQIALYPNLNSNDEVWRELVRDRRFRRALSLGVNRHEVNQVVYFGLVIEGNNTVLPASPLFREQYQQRWASYDVAQANRLLDEMGLVNYDDRGIRLRPDGEPLDIIVHTAGESTEETDALELIHDSWLKLGIKLYTKPSQREVFRNRVFAGEAMMSVWSGVDNGIPTRDMSPAEFVPSSQQQLQWPSWGQYFETNGNAGEPPDIESAVELVELDKAWRQARSAEEKERIWHRILEINADEVFTIGVVCGVPQPVVVSNLLSNIPEKGIYSWAPTSYFGVYNPDTFWFVEQRQDGN